MELLIFIIYNITMKIKNPYSALVVTTLRKLLLHVIIYKKQITTILNVQLSSCEAMCCTVASAPP